MVGVDVATGAERLVAGTVWVAPGGRHLRISRKLGGYIANLSDEMPVSGHKPSIDVMFDSASRQAGANGIGVILTGASADGDSATTGMRLSGDDPLRRVNDALAWVRMPLFMILSGYVYGFRPVASGRAGAFLSRCR